MTMATDTRVTEHREVIAALLTIAFESGRHMGGSYVPDTRTILSTFKEFVQDLKDSEDDGA
jgi:hypothetical protein